MYYNKITFFCEYENGIIKKLQLMRKYCKLYAASLLYCILTKAWVYRHILFYLSLVLDK